THPSLDLLDDSDIESETIWFSANASSWPFLNGPTINYSDYGFTTYLHEIGHALGLSHPGPYDASQGGGLNYAADAVFAQDNRQYTIMSYFGYETDGSSGWTQDGTPAGGATVLYPATPMVYDMLAIQD